ncbi:MAG: twin-arginine translocase subunit TatC [Phycisphaerae bacterium]|nr:twin-arginine translocase subunit TatC [Planctomycetia bacterium]MCK6464952.1 twin-arginine translocase subunit TatC [Phycisphaerae bacterium]MCL4719419.1 twin-arginine translocase subunit TatC [Phycisphaerae bacterium]NUQ08169.1 twin-arginine translocase subunit TatC [Phycisphaerae bacterium]
MSNDPQTNAASAEPGDPEYMEATRMSFGDHLEELRIRLILSLIGVVAGAVLGLIFAKSLMSLLCQPLIAVLMRHHLPSQLVSLSPASTFSVYMKLGLLSGLILAMPWVLVQIWQFVASGLYPKEQRFVQRFLPVSIGLFALGVGFVYWIVLPIVLNFFVTFNESFAVEFEGLTGIQRLLIGDPHVTGDDDAANPDSTAPNPLNIPILPQDPPAPKHGDTWLNLETGRLCVRVGGETLTTQLSPGSGDGRISSQFSVDFYTSFVLMLMLAFGLAFQLPIAVFFLVWAGLVTTEQLGRSRKIIILVIFIIAAVLTPPDVVSQILLAIPMWGLFEAGLIFAKRWKAVR